MMKRLNEDIGYASEGNYRDLRHNLNPGGSRIKLSNNQIIFRPPTKKEIQAAGLNPSDYQIAQVRVLSKILFDFGLSSQVYRSKKATLSKNNAKKIEKFKTIFRTFLQNFKPNEPIANVRRAFALVTNDTFTAVDLVNILKATKNWHSEEQILSNISTIYRNINEYNKMADPSAKDLKIVRDMYNHLSNYIDTEERAGNSSTDIIRSITYANSINNVMAEPELENAYDIVYKDVNVNTVSDLEADIGEYLSSQQTEGKSRHANTVLHEEALENMKKLSTKMKDDGLSGDFTTANVFEYLKSNEPNIVDYLNTAYGLSADKLTAENFPTWESLAQYFYKPKMLYHIDKELLDVDERARSKGATRKGALLAVDVKAVKARKDALKKQIEKRKKKESNVSATSLEDKLAAKEEEYEEAKRIRDKFKEDYLEASRVGKKKSVLNELEKKYEEAKAIAFKIGKSAASIRHMLKNAAKSGKPKKIEKSDIEKLKDLEKEEKKIISNARKKLSDEDDVREFDAMYGKVEDENDPWNWNEKEEVNYLSWNFIVNSKNPKILGFIVNELDSALKRLNKYVNISTYEPEYEDVVGTQIFIDYPGDSKLAKLLELNPNLAKQIMNSVTASAREKFKTTTSYYNDDELIKVNQEF